MTDIICAGNAVKEIMSAAQSLAALEAGVRGAGEKESGNFLISDGGDGFLEACGQNQSFQRHETNCTGPLGDAITAPFLFDPKTKTAYIETALCCGLKLVEESRRNLMISGTAGVAEMVASAREIGAVKIIVGLGGSATCDGGAGFLWRLAELSGQCQQGGLDPRVAMDMPELPSPDIAALRLWLGAADLVVCVDVDNPLNGPNGAACVFAPQKGADAEQTEQLEGWMGDWCERIERNAGVELCELPGSGAAGGLGFAMAAVGGRLVPGARTVFEVAGLSNAVTAGMTLVTTEGMFDATSLNGKATWEAALLARERGAHATIFCGIADEAATAEAAKRGISIVEFGRNLSEEQRVKESPEKLAQAVTNFFQSRPGAGV